VPTLAAQDLTGEPLPEDGILDEIPEKAAVAATELATTPLPTVGRRPAWAGTWMAPCSAVPHPAYLTSRLEHSLPDQFGCARSGYRHGDLTSKGDTHVNGRHCAAEK
jgi:hypothetical protein